MRALDQTNPMLLRPSQFAVIGAIVPIGLGLSSLALVHVASPGTSFYQSPPAIMIAAVLIATCALALTSLLCKWDWQTKYFGIISLYIASIALLGLVPCLCIILYGHSPMPLRIAVFLIYVCGHYAWCRQFIRHYRSIMRDKVLRDQIYEEEAEAIYYRQRADRRALEVREQDQVPNSRFFACALVLALLMALNANAITRLTGLPFIHSFLTVFAFPISLMGLGLATRGWLIYYHYPMLIRRETGKPVYVDLAGHLSPRVLRGNR